MMSPVESCSRCPTSHLPTYLGKAPSDRPPGIMTPFVIASALVSTVQLWNIARFWALLHNYL